MLIESLTPSTPLLAGGDTGTVLVNGNALFGAGTALDFGNGTEDLRIGGDLTIEAGVPATSQWTPNDPVAFGGGDFN